MKLLRKRATLLLCAVATVSFAGTAMAKPVHKAKAHHAKTHYAKSHYSKQPRHAAAPARQVRPAAGIFDTRSAEGQPYPMAGAETAQASYASAETPVRGAGRVTSRTRRSHTGDAFGGPTSNVLVSQARAYMGTNPTGRSRAWCGAFLDMVLKKTGHRGGGNLARAYAGYGTRVAGPQVGAIAVMRNHVGVVSGIDPNGNPIVVSGNHNRTVAESVYSRGRIMAYVVPNG